MRISSRTRTGHDAGDAGAGAGASAGGCRHPFHPGRPTRTPDAAGRGRRSTAREAREEGLRGIPDCRADCRLSVWPVQLQLRLSVGGCLQSVNQSGSRDRQLDRMRQASNGGSKRKRHRIATIEKRQVRSGHQTHCDERSEKEKSSSGRQSCEQVNNIIELRQSGDASRWPEVGLA